MEDGALIIPESKDTWRSEISTYIFSFSNAYKKLHMRFSMRKDNISSSTRASDAITRLKKIIDISVNLIIEAKNTGN